MAAVFFFRRLKDFVRQPLAWGSMHRPKAALIHIAHEVIKRLKEANFAKWLFASNLAVCPGSPITPERNAATGLVITPPVWEMMGF
jgi:hypothetical protein